MNSFLGADMGRTFGAAGFRDQPASYRKAAGVAKPGGFGNVGRKEPGPMRYGSVGAFTAEGRTWPAHFPCAVIFAEDDCLLAETVDHHLALGFAQVLLLAPEEIQAPQVADPARMITITCDCRDRDGVPEALNRLIAASPRPGWLYWGYNAEFLFYPFCESRTVGELLAFHAEERRSAMMACVVDLYAGDLSQAPDGVSRSVAMFDGSGYYATDRFRDGVALDRQVEIFGGLRRRFEEHVPWTRRRIDRVALFQTARGVQMRPDLTLSDEEMNTLSCPWHNNLTAAVMSFRAAKALRSNPGSKRAIRDFRWSGSVPFNWSSRELLEHGLMEPGQWF